MRNIAEYAITPEMPKVAFEQQLNVHVPVASTFNKGIAQYDAEHFSVANGVVKLNNSILEKFTNIVYTDSLPDLSEANSNLLYHVMTDYDTIWICDNDKTRWIQLDKAIHIVNSMNDIVDASKLYCILNGDDSGVYILYNNAPLKLLTNTDYLELTSKITELRDNVNDKETALKQQIEDVQDTADSAVNTANSAITQSQTAFNVSNQAQETANSAEAKANNALELAQGYDQEIEEIAQTASNASSTANSASTKADSALQKAEEALNKAGSVTGVFVPKGNASSIDDLPTPSAETLGWLYNMTNDFTTTADFVEGADINYKAGENVAIIEPTDDVYKYDVFSGTVDLSTIQSDIATLQGQMADLLYKAISITSFTNNKSTQEIGSSVTAVTLTWAFSKTPVSVTLDGVSKAVNSTGESLTGLSITANKTWTLKATDERNYTATRTTSISFLNGVYYGVATAPETYDSEFILELTKTLRSSKLPSFTVTADEGQYIYYCIPTRFGTASFKVGGFDGGIALVDTISFTNASGYTEDYYIYRSDYPNLGGSTVVVS